MTEDGPLSLSKLIGGGYNDFWHTHKKYVVIRGAKGSKKSTTTALRWIHLMMKYPLANLLVIRKFGTTLRDSCFAMLLWAINQLGVQDYWSSSVNPLELTYLPTGQKVKFRGLDDSTKLGSLAVTKGYICWVWVEEAYEITKEDDFFNVVYSIRGELPPGYFRQFVLTFNPWSEHHWMKKRFFDPLPDDAPDILKAERADTMTKVTTYKCNEFLGEDVVRDMEALRERNPRRARVVLDGEWGVSEGLIYENWEVRDFDKNEILKRPGIRTSFGLDFGYAVSYNAFVAVLVDLNAHTLWIYDEMYERGLTNIDIAIRITNMGYAKEEIWADCAEPKSIHDLRAGLIRQEESSTGMPVYTTYTLPNIHATYKGGDSVSNGIQRVQSFKMIVHPSCTNTIMELNSYAYDQDKFGNYIDKPIKEYDHLMDALRYSMEKFFAHGRGHVMEVKGEDRGSTHRYKARRVVSSI